MTESRHERKILDRETLPEWRKRFRDSGRRLVATNGCFDLLHPGHVTLLEAARNQGDGLVVGISSDHSVRTLKGPPRPVLEETHRAKLIAALECVDAVYIFPEVRAVGFLEMVLPEIYVKGGDYTIDELPAEERAVVARCQGEIRIIPMVPDLSTTRLIQRIRSNPDFTP